jgi:hypothetical protein
LALTRNPTAAIAIAPATAPVNASITAASAGLGSFTLSAAGDNSQHCRLKKVAAQAAGNQSGEAVSYPTKTMLVQGRRREMSSGEAGNDLHDQVGRRPIHRNARHYSLI